ncbi:MAG TPA: hypothetical protein VEM76_17625 [Anaeromyxobacteraceae bacterium]|nr:hypothetical protein [Anaeromyxobacteraceae bacterium]
MTTYAGGTAVKSGYYLDLRTFTFAQVARDGGKLPGGDEQGFTRVPAMLVLAAAPVLGGAFVVALPFIAFGVTAYAIGKRLTGVGHAGAREVAATLAPPWAPGAAHLTGAPPSEQGAPAADARIDELAGEIDAKRKE